MDEEFLPKSPYIRKIVESRDGKRLLHTNEPYLALILAALYNYRIADSYEDKKHKSSVLVFETDDKLEQYLRLWNQSSVYDTETDIYTCSRYLFHCIDEGTSLDIYMLTGAEDDY